MFVVTAVVEIAEPVRVYEASASSGVVYVCVCCGGGGGGGCARACVYAWVHIFL